jgi:hypothetical protein
VGKPPGVKDMQDFYQREKARGLPVPHILGLSAGPVMKAKDQSPKKIEKALDSICRTPKRHRAELMEHVNMPELRQILYVETMPEFELQEWSPTLHGLYKTYSEYDMNKDPYIIQLRADESERSQQNLAKVLMNQKTIEDFIRHQPSNISGAWSLGRRLLHLPSSKESHATR